ncbi:DUF6684 family protein [Halorarum salinum]|uniref:Cox cluster protein n=1 Tax=Halorarum salinum TaxID=2743089 RepID=A0A7D5Q7X4_9EURY|nr:DUF6684 family protein [Halobaculum salinum]QLG60537.1 cox cluster protein [Halobaculum salinum]
MATIFDRETLLDLTVNVIPLGMILIFGVGYLIFNPWADDGLFGNLLMIGLHAVPFIGLLVLTYVSGKAIAGDEQRSSVYHQGQAAVRGAEEKHAVEGSAEDGSSAAGAETTGEAESTVTEGETAPEQ